MTRALLLVAAAVLAGCGSSESSTTPAKAPTGKATLRFDVESNVRASSKLTDALKGTVYGNVYLAEDVNLGGPIEGAKAYANIVLEIDVAAAGPSTASIEVPDLPENKYIFLGFFDVDGNGATSKDPDAGDPVTMPTDDNKFDVPPNGEVDAVVKFNLVYGG